MSITFWSDQDSEITTTYDCLCDGAVPSCYECKGTGKVHFTGKAHAVNLSNSNAWRLLPVMGLVQDYGGTVDQCDMPAVVLRLQQARRTCRVDDDGRVQALLTLFRAAVAGGWQQIHWG